MTARRRLLLLVLPLGVCLLAAAALAFPPFVRHQAQDRAQRYGLSLQAESVLPSLLGVRLANVTLSSPDIPSLALHADAILVGSSSITVQGGAATIQADYQTFAREVQAWRDKLPTKPEASSGQGSRTAIALDGFSLSWPNLDGAGSSLSLRDVRVDDLFGARALSAGRVELRHATASVDGEAVRLAWSTGESPRIQSLTGRHIRAEVRLGASGGGRAPEKAAPHTDLRRTMARLAALAWAPMTPDGKVEVEAFEVLVHHDSEQINIGPGILSVQHNEGAILIDLAPRVEAGATGITFRGSVPMADGPVILDVVGGPISLATLGVQEGNLGLVNVQRVVLTSDAHLKLHPDGQNLSFDGTFLAKNVGVSHPRVAPAPVLGLELAAKLRGQVSLDGAVLRLDEGQVDVGKVQLQLRGTVDRSRDKARVDVHFGIPLVACQSFLDALPSSLIPVVHGMTAAGTLSLAGHLRWDEANDKDFHFDYQAGNDCRVTSVPSSVDVRTFRSPFKRRAYDAKGNPVVVDTGPGTPGWVGRDGISHFIEAAVMTCEDGRFRRHRGFDHEAIHNSVRENLRARKFLRGASTISMQLAKNLYLGREKTISRKLQELILTTYLEQALTKDQIMELYLNVVEFGPMTFGIGNASSRYFNKHPASLSLGQSMYLASILPAPSRQHFGKDGKVTDGWMRYLYKLMRIAAKMRWVSEVELDYGLGEWVVYGSPDPIRLTPGPEEAEQEPDEDEDLEPEDGDPFGWKPERAPAY
jgi:hypothetical protein